MGLATLKSKPRIVRLKRSVGEVSNSQRRPRLSVSLRVSFQSSCTYSPVKVDCSEYDAFRSMPPPVGMPRRKLANPWPIGPAVELSSGPLVQPLEKSIFGAA